MENSRKKWLGLLLPLALFICINIVAFFPTVVERYYSSGIYTYISILLRLLFGWLPFSMGDVLYSLAVIWLIIRLWKTLKAIITKKVTGQSFLASVRRTLAVVLWVYVLFYSLWGLNYDRLGIAYQLKLDRVEYNTADLQQLTTSLIEQVNSTRLSLGDSVAYPGNKEMFGMAVQSYKQAQQKFSFLDYRATSVKSSMWGWLGNYTGFLGYYNPFSAEAQVNTTVPRFVIPFTVCHEIGHQLGYGSEDEANFSGYLAATASADKRFRYSAYFDLFSYANRELFYRDSAAARANYKMLDTLVRKDLQEYKRFILKHENDIEPLITLIYGKYLEANNQPNGLKTYNEVVGWLIAYRKKYGDL